jgi:phosphoglycolate phosphatase
MVGDSNVDIDTAKAAAVPSVAVSFGYSAEPVAELGADRVIDHYDDLFATARSLLSTA